MTANITGGMIHYSETRKIADYESKTAKVELSFNVAEGADHAAALDHVKHTAKQHCLDMIGHLTTLNAPKLSPEHLVSEQLKAPHVETNQRASVAEASVEPKPTKVHNKRAPKMPVAEQPSLDEAVQNKVPFDLPAEEDALLKTGGDQAKIAMLITDEELTDATTKHQQQVKNPIAIRKLISDCGGGNPPKLYQIPQEQRQKYLDELKNVKALA